MDIKKTISKCLSLLMKINAANSTNKTYEDIMESLKNIDHKTITNNTQGDLEWIDPMTKAESEDFELFS